MRSMLVLLCGAVALACPAVPASARTDVRHEGDSWVVENARLRVAVAPGTGHLEVADKAAHATYHSVGNETSLRDVVATPAGLRFTAQFWARGTEAPTKVSLEVPDGRADLILEADRDDRAAALEMLAFLPPLAPEGPAPAMVVADYSNGHLYPLDWDPFPGRWFGGDRLDMPFVGVTDTKSGSGYALILETPEDAVIESKPWKVGERTLSVPQLLWLGSKGAFAHPRRAFYRFVETGGHVGIARAYRAYARDHGLLVTLAEKARSNPNLDRLLGATDVWGGGLAFARQAKEAGVEHLLVQGRFRPEEIRAINELGYLTSEYDNYTDVTPIDATHPLDSNHDAVPESVVRKADGERMTAWLTYDKKTQFMKRCPALWVPAAEQVVPRVLAERPFLGRFIDVTTAEGLYECFDPAHPLTRADKRACGERLLAYVRSRDLVVGGEHGIWWAVPHLDYVEGMMSGGHAAWPAGHLVRPKSRDETYAVPVSKWEAYDRDGIGHGTRIPLWELVFHDCVVTTWYWGDSSDFLIQLNPTNQDRKDAFNVLYGTMPLLWANRDSGWEKDRDRFLRTCKVVGAVFRSLAGSEMTSHAFLTEDHALQRTTFSNGAEVVVNFGSEPREATLAGVSHVLPQHGFAVVGPKLEAFSQLVDGKSRTTVREK